MLFTFATVVFLLTAACSSAGDEGNSTGYEPQGEYGSKEELIRRNFYWYTKHKYERVKNRVVPMALDRHSAKDALCEILVNTFSCDDIRTALTNYSGYVPEDDPEGLL
uniref:Peptidase_M13_N domain-containing protein n=1 Tax=Ascaris lumbricoides TaxID=6252 RepID=A0A0M3HPG4_ASCLU